ncbi:MAG: HAMP domain-containing histidine kinase [Ruminiclostridium sp.]|nr:HAMP domain-containing histidine kinase [Ruminiclostridium sp.]
MESIFLFIAIALAIALTAICILLLQLYRRARQESHKKDAAIAAQLEEIEMQNKSIKNLSDLYDSTIQYDKDITDFFINITHELKTPLSVIMGAIQLMDLKNQASTEECGKNAGTHQIIRINCYRILRLVNNLLDFARLDSGHLKLNPVNCNIVGFVEEITQSVIPYARQKQLTLLFDTQHEEIITAIDTEKIERVILNLLSNAIKFTGQGGQIKVAIHTMDNRVCISVKDTGIGIPRDKQNEIFERFQQVCSNKSKEFEGSGIGLSLVKSFVDLHQGTINVISEENHGSEFIISLPLRCLETHEGKTEEPPVPDHHSKITEAINIEFSSSLAS